jgi:uncharacterized protein with GYD domain|tara:strand:+ start:393 stop:710 length:318 start_codon:yes stop_codon:yes gene_type:complete
MVKYIGLGTYSNEAVKGLLGNDSDRTTAVEETCNSVGAKFLNMEVTRGLYDFILTVESDTFEKVAAVSLTARAAGVVSDLVILESVDISKVREAAKGVKYTPPQA